MGCILASHRETTSGSSAPTASVNRSTSKRFIATNVETSASPTSGDEPGVRLELVERRAEVERGFVPACASSMR